MKKKNLTIIAILVVCLMVVAAIVFSGRQSNSNNREANKKKEDMKAEDKFSDEDIDYSGLGNEQGNTENGGYQTYLKGRGILIDFTDNSGGYMACFDESTQELTFLCTKSSCLHTGNDCVSNQKLRYLFSYSTVAFGVSDSTTNEIWKYQNNKTECFYRSDDDIHGIWGYQGYLYFMTDFGVFRISIENPSEKEQVSDRPVLFEYLTFYEDKMYFCEEDELLYEANLDGSEKKRFCDEKALAPQVCNGILYYRSAEFDEKGEFQIKNTLKGVSIKDKKEEVILDEVYQFNVSPEENKIYYTDLPVDEETDLNVLSLDSGKKEKIVSCASAYLNTFPQTDWIVFEKLEGESDLQEGEMAAKPTHLYCIKKDGSGERRLDYPERINE